MSNLYAHVHQPFRKTGMAWTNQMPDDRRVYHPIHVKHAGFAGLVGDREFDEEMRDAQRAEGGGGDEFDEDLYDEVRPEPTPHEQAHYDENDEYPDSYYERHDQAYAEAKDRKAHEDEPDHDDPALMGFVREHGSNTRLWHDYGRTGRVNLRQPVYATQSHVAREFIDKYKRDPHAQSHHQETYGHVPGRDYLGEEHPMFVTHHGRLHVTEGHHRVAAELEKGSPDMVAHHFNLDEHPQFEYGEGAGEDE